MHGNLELKKFVLRSKPQKCAVVVKANFDTTWEAIVPEGKSFAFNVVTWGETMRKLLQPIMALSNKIFSMIIEETQDYIKASAKEKGKSGQEELPDMFDFH